MDKDLILEICDVICDRVMENVDQRINLSLHQTNTYIQQLQNDVQTLKKENQQLHSNISELEEKIRNIKKPCNDNTTKEEAEYNGSLNPQRITARAVDGISTLSAEEMEEILSMPNYYREGNGWIYYIKEIRHNVGELHKVRTDGTENQKIFSGNVDAYETTAKYHLKLNGNMLSFTDANGRTRTIKV